jgi:hypothetical protein
MCGFDEESIGDMHKRVVHGYKNLSKQGKEALAKLLIDVQGLQLLLPLINNALKRPEIATKHLRGESIIVDAIEAELKSKENLKKLAKSGGGIAGLIQGCLTIDKEKAALYGFGYESGDWWIGYKEPEKLSKQKQFAVNVFAENGKEKTGIEIGKKKTESIINQNKVMELLAAIKNGTAKNFFAGCNLADKKSLPIGIVMALENLEMLRNSALEFYSRSSLKITSPKGEPLDMYNYMIAFNNCKDGSAMNHLMDYSPSDAKVLLSELNAALKIIRDLGWKSEVMERAI